MDMSTKFRKVVLFMRMRLLVIVYFVCFMFVVSSCSEKTDSGQLFPTKEEAIDYWSKKENAKVLTTEEFENEQFVLLLTSTNLVTVASITKKENGFKWYRNSPFFKVDSTIMLNYETESSKTVPLVIGKVNNHIKKVRLESPNTLSAILDAKNGYFLGLNIPKSNYKVIPIE